MLEKCKVIYKGDIATAKFYILVGIILFTFAFILTYINISAGFNHLSLGFYILAAYCSGKGLFMWISYRQRLIFYESLVELNPTFQKGEIEFTQYRITKKNKNRRGYIYMLIISAFFAFIGVFSQHKALIMGTSIPIVLISGLEIGLGLLTEFRLSIFLRELKKNNQHYPPGEDN